MKILEGYRIVTTEEHTKYDCPKNCSMFIHKGILSEEAEWERTTPTDCDTYWKHMSAGSEYLFLVPIGYKFDMKDNKNQLPYEQRLETTITVKHILHFIFMNLWNANLACKEFDVFCLKTGYNLDVEAFGRSRSSSEISRLQSQAIVFQAICQDAIVTIESLLRLLSNRFNNNEKNEPVTYVYRSITITVPNEYWNSMLMEYEKQFKHPASY